MGNAKKTTLLCILDGFGFNPNPEGNAVRMAKKPNFDRIYNSCPASTLITNGERVGLPEGQMGNSEVGHLNIGAGRVVEQWLLRISRRLKDGSFRKANEYQAFLKNCADGTTLHLIGLYSNGGVHSHQDHLLLLLEALAKDWPKEIALHLITDGRDTPPHSSLEQIRALEELIKNKYPKVSIASVSGRFYAMDRDKRWDRVARAYSVIGNAQGEIAASASEWIAACYERGITDEFIDPAVISAHPIGAQDGLLFWNFRADRMREIVAALCSKTFDGFTRTASPVPAAQTLCFAEYDRSFNLPFLFSLDPLQHHLGQVLAEHGLTQLRVAETEKYPHVTYFFNGGIEAPYSGEERKMVPSPRDVKTYDQKPEMSAQGVADIVVSGIESGAYDFIVVNFANCDMVGHTGVLDAAIKAVETVDACLGRVLDTLNAHDGQAVVIADHGNAEQMIDYRDGSPHTAHTTYPVPVVIVGAPTVRGVQAGGALCDVAPTILDLLDVAQPPEMTGRSLIQR